MVEMKSPKRQTVHELFRQACSQQAKAIVLDAARDPATAAGIVLKASGSLSDSTARRLIRSLTEQGLLSVRVSGKRKLYTVSCGEAVSP